MTEVYLNDAGISWDESELLFHNAHAWASQHCGSYRGHHVQDVSDVSYVYDNIALYLFDREEDATAFILRWK